MTWTAGWNMPGYLPDNVAEFEDRIDAHNYILDAVERFWDEDYMSDEDSETADERWLIVHTALATDQSGEFQELAGDGSLAFWITEQD